MVAAQLVLGHGHAKTLDIARTGTQAHGPRRHATHHQVGGLGPHVAERDVHLAAAEAEQLGGHLQVHTDVGPVLLQALNGGHQQVDGDGVGAGHAHQAARAGVLALDAGAQVQGRAFHAAGGGQRCLARGGEQVAILGAQEELGAQHGLQRIQPPPHGGLVHAQAARAARKEGARVRARKMRVSSQLMIVPSLRMKAECDANLHRCRAKLLRLNHCVAPYP